MTDDIDLRELSRYSAAEIKAKNYILLNVFSVYILSRLAASQSMGLIGSGFKNRKAVNTMMSKRFPALPDADPPLASLPYVTPQTLAYAHSLVISAVCYSRTDIMTKGKASLLYEKLYDEYAKGEEEEFISDLRATIRSFLFNATAAEVEPATLPSAAQAATSAAPPGTRDADWLLGLDEAKPSDDVDAVAGAVRKQKSVAAAAAAGGGGDADAAADTGSDGDGDGGIEEDSDKLGNVAVAGDDGAAAAGSQTPTPKESPDPKQGKKEKKAAGGKQRRRG